jgi:hypothetical protein
VVDRPEDQHAEHQARVQACGVPLRPQFQVEFFTYEGLVRVMDEWEGSQTLPHGLICDESSR